MPFEATFYGDWATISVMAAAIAVIASAMLIMFSRLFDLRNLEQIAKTEFTYAASTVLIVLVVVVIIGNIEPLLAGGSNSLARSLYLASVNCPQTEPVIFGEETLIDWMKLYLETPTKCVQDFMTVLYYMSVPVEAVASVYLEIFMSEHASGFGVKWIAERITNTAQSLSFYMYIYFLLVHVLNFIKYYAGFFFSIGVALRAFPPTRGTGAYLMAISFGLYFVFPLSYILIATMSLPHAGSAVIGTTCNPDTVKGGFEYFCTLPQVPSVESYQCKGAMSGAATDYMHLLEEIEGELTDLITFRVNDFVRHLVSSICIFPLVALVILLTFVLNTTNLFGGNIPEIGRGLVKLI